MGVVRAEVQITEPPEAVMAVAQRVEDFPAFMPDVTAVRVLSRDPETGLSLVDWEAKVEVQSIRKKIHWVEEARWDFAGRRCDFTQKEGDYKRYGGFWTFESAYGGTKLVLEVDFDLGLPLVGPLINKLLDKLMRENCEGMLKAIKARVETERANN